MHPAWQKLGLLGLLLALAGCGGGHSSQVITPSITLVTPIATTIAAGTSLQLDATVSNSDNQTVLWSVNNIPGGNAFVGTITPQGLYTAPNIPTANGSVVISAAPQVFPAVATSLKIGITFANASLNGNFVFSLNGTQGGQRWAAAGSFTASNGNITSGIEDVNGPNGVAQSVAFNGSYFVDASGLGVATLTSTQGTVNLSFTLNTQGQASVMDTDPNTAISGQFYPQQSTALTLTSLNSPFVFSFTGGNASQPELRSIGSFVTNGSDTLAAAEEDFNDGSSTVNQSFSGSYTIGSGGRGTATFAMAGGTRSFSFYIVSPQQLQFIETDTSANLNGTAFQQQSISSSTALFGTYVFYVSGLSSSSAYGVAGGFQASTTSAGNVAAGTSDVNAGGAVTSNPTLGGSFTLGANGRGTLALSGASGTQHYVFYLITPSSGYLLATDSGMNAGGQMFFQSGGYTTAGLAGNYNFSVASTAGAAAPALSSGLLTLNSAGAIAGFENSNSGGTVSGQLSVTGVYAITAFTATTATRGTMTLTTNGGASSNYVLYPISSGSVILLGTSGDPTLGFINSQYQ